MFVGDDEAVIAVEGEGGAGYRVIIEIEDFSVEGEGAGGDGVVEVCVV